LTDLLTTSEAAGCLSVSVATLRRWASAGLVPSERTRGGHRRFRRTDLLRFARRGQPDEPAVPWADALLAPDGSLALEAALLRARREHGSWWAVWEAHLPSIGEIYRRQEAGLITTVQLQAGLEGARRALSRFLDHLPPGAERASVLLTAIPGDRTLVPLLWLSLCAPESGWAARWGGHASPEELASELARQPSDAVLVSASLGVDRGVAGRFAAGFDALAGRIGTPLALVGSWPDRAGSRGAARLAKGREVRTWLERLGGGREPG
jgi:excisionase family DNA binding protein